MNVTKSAVSTNSLCGMLTEMGERLTHLLLADNRIAGIQQIVTAIAVSILSKIQKIFLQIIKILFQNFRHAAQTYGC